MGIRTSQDDHSQRRADVLFCPVTVEMRRVATTATLDMHPRDVDSVWRKADDTGDREGEEAASKQRSCWGIACPSSSWSGLSQHPYCSMASCSPNIICTPLQQPWGDPGDEAQPAKIGQNVIDASDTE